MNETVPGSPAGLKLPVTPATEDGATVTERSAPDVQLSSCSAIPNDWSQEPDLPSFQDIAFQFNVNDDPALWEGALDQIDIDMDTDWIENLLKR